MPNWNKLKGKLSFDINKKADAMGKGIEDPIKPLVIVLNLKGFQTKASCGGYTLEELRTRIKDEIFKEDRFQFVVRKKFGGSYGDLIFNSAPWVEIKVNGEQYEKLQLVLIGFNQVHKVHWNLRQIQEEVYRLEADYQNSFKDLKNAILELSNFLYENL